MSYDSAIASMFALGHELANTPSHKFDLDHMRILLEALDHPERRFPSVLIAGTNGKGSTAATLAAILQASGYNTGLYTSPHLVRINERIRFNGAAISDDSFAALHHRVAQTAETLVASQHLPWHPSFFEMLTAIAFVAFAEAGLDIAILEVGMGGRLDATNVVDPMLSIITDISLDHQNFLGDTVTAIAREKAGIIRPGGIVVTLPQSPEANDVIGHAMIDLGAHGVSAVPFVPPVSPGADAQWRGTTTYPLTVLNHDILIDSPLTGRHQLRNLALAIAAAEQLALSRFPYITAATIARGIHQTRWPGRFQFLPASATTPDTVFDVAHNPAGAWALRAALSATFEDRPLTFIFGVMRDKAIAEMTEILFPVAHRVIVTHADNPRAASPAEIKAAATRVAVEIEEARDVASALAMVGSGAPSQTLVVVTGSIYIVGEAMHLLGVRI